MPPALGDGDDDETTLSTRGLQGIRVLSVNDLFVTAGAGTLLSELQAELRPHQVWVPLASPWAESTLGGIVSANFNAPMRSRYGGIRDLLLAATTVLPAGRVFAAGRAVVKNVAGYDLLKLFIGAYGTLGVVSDVTFKLSPFPRLRSTAVVPIDDLGQGLRIGGRLLRVCLVASSLLLYRAWPLPGTDPVASSPYALIYTAEGLVEDVEAELAEVQAVLESEGVRAIVPGAEDGLMPEDSRTTGQAASGSEVWGAWLRREGTVVRVGVAPKDLARLMVDIGPLIGDTPCMADFAGGMLWLRDSDEIEPIRQAARALGGYAIVLPGPASQARRPETRVDPWGHSPDGLDLMRSLKARWDPRNLLNPGAFII